MVSPTTLPGMLLRQVHLRPEAPAVVDDHETLTRAELAAHGAHLAERLVSAGVGPDSIVGLFLDPSIDLVVATWGVLLAGAGYLPLAPDYPEDRIAYMIEDSQLEVVITQPHLLGKLEDVLRPGVTVVTLDGARPAAGQVAPESAADETNIAYVIYTSGTTGRPKGAVIEQRSIASQLAWLRDEMGIDHRETVLLKTPISFDAAQWELLAVAAGSTIVVGKPGVHRDPSALIDAIIAHDVTALQCVPTVLQALVDDERFELCTSLRRVFSGGEALSRKLATRVREVLPGAALINLYGPTECTINATAHVVDDRTLASGQHTVPIGHPVRDTTVYIVDDSLRPVPPGVTGELYLGGVQLARGYLHRDEETAKRFVSVPMESGVERLYRTGDLAAWNDDGTVRFVGRGDNQVKLRGYRVELDEIRLAIENHDWVKNAAVLVKNDDRTGFQNLVACVELNPREAALMDQGSHGAHHQSKESRVQVRAQLANLGLREEERLAGRAVVELPGRAATSAQRRLAFARKTYRFFDGGDLTRAELLDLLGARNEVAGSTRLDRLTLADLGRILRHFGQFHSEERLLPKYAYASPGALYATQLYLEISGVGGVEPGVYYFHPVEHRLVLVHPGPGGREPLLRAHFIGKRAAIESVYRNNVLEVLEFETGHMLGLFDGVLPEFGLAVGRGAYSPDVAGRLDLPDGHPYLGSYDIVPFAERREHGPVDTYVQVHSEGVADLAVGQYRYENGDLARVSDSLVLKKHVIAINQEVYERSSVGISLISRSPVGWAAYIDLGRRLQRLQQNPLGLGFMSSGYSSKTGNNLPSANRINSILRHAGLPSGPSYFVLGGKVSAAQIAHEGMNEDAVHTTGPAEMIKRDIGTFLPEYMVPGRVIIVDRLPYTANGKVDVRALERSDEVTLRHSERVVIGPRTSTERRVAQAWAKVMKTDDISLRDDFFETGGNSLLAVLLIQEINRTLGTTLPLQVIFEEPTIEGLARRADSEAGSPASRLVALAGRGSADRPIFCWPGLGGYPMNLTTLARGVGDERPFYGVQAEGINPGETAHPTVHEMARHDVALIRQRQPRGPYTLWGYSFGARVAFETAYQLEREGESVDRLILIAPGSPILHEERGKSGELYRDRAFVTILYSVFSGTITGPEKAACLTATHDEASFVAFISQLYPELDLGTIGRIVDIVRETYSFEYTFEEMRQRRVQAPITIFRAQGDDYSFLEGAMGSLPDVPTVVELRPDHYGLLKPPGVHTLISAIRRHTEETNMPHVNIKYFATPISDQKEDELVATITAAVREALGCDENAISIALEPISPSDWETKVYEPEIQARSHLLRKTPSY